MKRSMHAGAALLAIVVLSICATSQAVDGGGDGSKVSMLKLDKPCRDFAMDPATGAIAGVDPNNDTVTLFTRDYLDGKSTTLVGPTKVGKVPASIAFKKYKDKSYFVVACRKENTVYLLDATKLTVVKSFDASVKAPPQVAMGGELGAVAAPADPDDPFIYFAGINVRSNPFGRINVAQLSDPEKVGVWPFSSGEGPSGCRPTDGQRTAGRLAAMPPGVNAH
jgi:DNA-binding beta-propeller fold protein YncE